MLNPSLVRRSSSLAVYPVLAAPLKRLHNLPHALVHREHDRLPGRNAQHARRDALVERPHALLPPHLARDRRDALDRRLARDRFRLLQACVVVSAFAKEDGTNREIASRWRRTKKQGGMNAQSVSHGSRAEHREKATHES